MERSQELNSLIATNSWTLFFFAYIFAGAMQLDF